MRAGHHVYRTKRWQNLRALAKRRDGYACVQCGERGKRLDVDHIKPISTHPELAYDLSNLQVMCLSCHAVKTKYETRGQVELAPDKLAWRRFTRELTSKPLSLPGVPTNA